MAKTAAKRVHVISRDDSWAVMKEGASRASKVFDSKESAVESAKKLQESGHDVIVHRKDGSIQRWEKSAK